MPHQCLQCGRTFDEGSPDLLRGCPGCGGTRFFFTQEPLDEAGRRELQAESEADLRRVIQEALATDGAGLGSWSDRQAWLRIDPKNVERTLREVVEEANATEHVTGRERDIVIAREDAPDPAEVAAAMDAASREVQEQRMDLEEPEPVEPEPVEAEPPAVSAQDLVESAKEEPKRTPTGPRAKRSRLQDLRPPPAEPGEVPAPRRKPRVRAAPPNDLEIVLRPLNDGTESATPGERPVSTVTIEEPGRYNIDVESLLDASPIIVEKDGVFMVHLPSIFDAVEKAKRGETGP